MDSVYSGQLSIPPPGTNKEAVKKKKQETCNFRGEIEN